MSKIPGFRSGKRWKKVIATLAYLFIALVVYAAATGDPKPKTVTTVPSSAVIAPVVEKTPEQIAQEKADAELRAKQFEEARVVTEAKVKADAEAKAKQDAADKAVADVKAAADAEARKPKHVDYKDLARNPDNYMGTNVIFTGKVIQVQESGKLVNLRVNVTKNTYGYENTVMIQYDKGIVSSRVLEDDIITFSGMSMGLLTYKTVMGAEMTIPQVLATNVTFQ